MSLAPLVPADVAEAGLMVQAAAVSSQRLAPLGAGTRSWFGRPAPDGLVPLSTARLQRVTHYEPDDLTVTAEAGLPFAVLRAKLRDAGQWLPVNPPRASGSTLGGLLATGASGSLRFRYGAWRDLVIGMTVVGADGVPVKSGGRVVKNVAGYDVHKLHLGALGTLGLIASVSLKVLPLPPARGLVLAAFAGRAAAALAGARASGSQMEPAAVELFDGALAGRLLGGAVPAGGTILAIRLAGLPADCAHSAKASLAELAASGGLHAAALEGPACDAAWSALDEAPAEAETIVRLVAPPSAIGALLDGAALPTDALAAADLATGVLHLLWPVAPEAASLASILAGLRRALAGTGHVTLWKAGAALSRQLDVWGPPPASYPLMLAVKQALDPRGLWNPGRFVGEL